VTTEVTKKPAGYAIGFTLLKHKFIFVVDGKMLVPITKLEFVGREMRQVTVWLSPKHMADLQACFDKK
jgi:hypothetical protein